MSKFTRSLTNPADPTHDLPNFRGRHFCPACHQRRVRQTADWITGNGGVISADLHNLLQGTSAAYSLGPQLSGPIFDAGRNKARVQAAQANANIARVAYIPVSWI